MIFIYSLERYELLLLIACFVVVAAICYYFAVKSRKTYICPECGEKTKVEHMETSRCGMCGSLLKQDEKV
jgi:ribosomal protein S27AE